MIQLEVEDEQQQQQQQPKDKRWGCKTCLKALLILNVMVLVAEFIVLQSTPLPDVLVTPNTTLFHRIHRPGTNLPYLYTIRKTRRYMREGQMSEQLEQIQHTINTTVAKIQNLKKPLFAHEPNTTGLVLTCKFDEVCLANLYHIFDNLNISIPVGLQQHHSCSLFFVSLHHHGVFVLGGNQ